jgi:glycosyltransferase involved in cell wall biosynthesis
MPRVLIIQAEMKHYRVPFFTKLHEVLRQDGIELAVAYSAQNRKQATRGDSAELPPEIGRKVPGFWFADRFLYQSLWKEIFSADLVIVGNENKYIINPFLLLLSALRLKTVAFWGLGPNMHPDRTAFSEWIKEKMITSVDWWFAYTETIADYLRQHGMPADRITNVQNATDTVDLRRQLSEIEIDEAAQAKFALTGNGSSTVGIYCGFLGGIKDIPMLVEAARCVRQRCPDFHLVIMGNGPDRKWLEQAITGDPWIHYMGSQFGRASAMLYKIADVFLLAGTAGLAIVDSFAAGLPLIATKLPTHPPEISYLRDGENGKLTAHTAAAFADAVIEVLTMPELMSRLCTGAERSGSRYTIEAMVESYSGGINQCFARTGVISRSPLKRQPYREDEADA